MRVSRALVTRAAPPSTFEWNLQYSEGGRTLREVRGSKKRDLFGGGARWGEGEGGSQGV